MSFLHGAISDVFFNRINLSVDHGFSLFSAPRRKILPHGFAPQIEHGDKIIVIRNSNREKFDGLGIGKYGSLACDAIVTDCKNFPLLMPNADCFLVALHDPKKNVLAVFHSGRLGTFANIARKTSTEMQKEFGCSPSDIIAYFFPGICKQDYRQKYLESDLPPAYLQKFSEKFADGEISLDLQDMIIHQLRGTGIERMNFRHCECTLHTNVSKDEKKYYSHFGHKHCFPGHEEAGRNALFVEMV